MIIMYALQIAIKTMFKILKVKSLTDQMLLKLGTAVGIVVVEPLPTGGPLVILLYSC
jgi:hypothetical protein